MYLTKLLWKHFFQKKKKQSLFFWIYCHDKIKCDEVPSLEYRQIPRYVFFTVFSLFSWKLNFQLLLTPLDVWVLTTTRTNWNLLLTVNFFFIFYNQSFSITMSSTYMSPILSIGKPTLYGVWYSSTKCDKFPSGGFHSLTQNKQIHAF